MKAFVVDEENASVLAVRDRDEEEPRPPPGASAQRSDPRRVWPRPDPSSLRGLIWMTHHEMITRCVGG
jgi:hypothetical protein